MLTSGRKLGPAPGRTGSGTRTPVRRFGFDQPGRSVRPGRSLGVPVFAGGASAGSIPVAPTRCVTKRLIVGNADVYSRGNHRRSRGGPIWECGRVR